MLGAITGDVIGSVYEFKNTKDYSFPLFTGRSIYTDDSILTIAVAGWLLGDRGHSYEGLERELVRYGKRYPHPMGGYGSTFHTWLFHPECLHDYGIDLPESPYDSPEGRHPYYSYGNGSAMRVSAVGWFFPTLRETLQMAAKSAAITHDHPEGIKGAQATAAAIFMARTGETKESIKSYIKEHFGYELFRSWYWYNQNYSWESSCQGTVPPAIVAFLESTDFEDAIRKAVSMGGDSDTLACITGGIAEAFYGGVPKTMADKVLGMLPEEFKTVLSEMAGKTAYGKIFI